MNHRNFRSSFVWTFCLAGIRPDIIPTIEQTLGPFVRPSRTIYKGRSSLVVFSLDSIDSIPSRSIRPDPTTHIRFSAWRGLVRFTWLTLLYTRRRSFCPKCHLSSSSQFILRSLPLGRSFPDSAPSIRDIPRIGDSFSLSLYTPLQSQSWRPSWSPSRHFGNYPARCSRGCIRTFSTR